MNTIKNIVFPHSTRVKDVVLEVPYKRRSRSSLPSSAFYHLYDRVIYPRVKLRQRLENWEWYIAPYPKKISKLFLFYKAQTLKSFYKPFAKHTLNCFYFNRVEQLELNSNSGSNFNYSVHYRV